MAKFRLTADQDEVDLPAGTILELPGATVPDFITQWVKSGDAMAVSDAPVPIVPLPGTPTVPPVGSTVVTPGAARPATGEPVKVDESIPKTKPKA